MPQTRVPRTIHRQVVEALAHRIVSRGLAAGDALPTETELCSELGVSRTILREAMKFLAAKGMVEIRPKIGTRVRPPDRWNLLDADVIGWRAEMGPDDQLIRDLIEKTRAEIILPLGGALIPYVVDPADLAKATGAQVLNTKAIGIRFAEMCVNFGMTQSSLTYPRAKLSMEDFTN